MLIYPDEPFVEYDPDSQGIIKIPCTMPPFSDLPSAGQTIIPASSPFLYNLRVYQIFHNAVFATQNIYISQHDKWTGEIYDTRDVPPQHVRGSRIFASYSVKSPPVEDWALSQVKYIGEQYGNFLPSANKLDSDVIELYTSHLAENTWVTLTNPYNGLNIEIYALGESPYHYYSYSTNITTSSRGILYGQYRHYRKHPGSIVPLLAGLTLPLLVMLGAAGGVSSTNQHQPPPAGRRRKTK